MKNVTIALDDETHRLARIHAAAHGTSLSALVKAYLQSLADAPAMPAAEVRDMPTPFQAHPPVTAQKPMRQPGALRGKLKVADDFDDWPQWLLDAFEGKDSDLPWPE